MSRRHLTLDDLRRLSACNEAVEWAATQPDLETAWRTCQRAEWMLWLLARCGANPYTLRQIAADCAERVLPIWENRYPDDDRPRRAIAVARDPDATERERADAYTRAIRAADYAAAQDDARAADAADTAAYAAADAAADAADADAASAACDAARDAAYAACDAAAADAARVAERAAQADIVRRHHPDLPTAL